MDLQSGIDEFEFDFSGFEFLKSENLYHVMNIVGWVGGDPFKKFKQTTEQFSCQINLFLKIDSFDKDDIIKRIPEFIPCEFLDKFKSINQDEIRVGNRIQIGYFWFVIRRIKDSNINYQTAMCSFQR